MPARALFRLFPAVARASNAFERRVTTTGGLFASVWLVGTILGVDMRQTTGYQLAALAFGLLATSLLCSVYWRPRVGVRRVLPDSITVGVDAHYWLELTNHGRRVESGLEVQDCLVTPAISFEDFTRARDSGERSNWFDRAVGFPRWVALRKLRRGADLPLRTLPPLAPAQTVRVKLPLTALRRGELRFADIRLLRADPLGLMRAVSRTRLSDKLVALPRRHPVAQVAAPSQRRYQRGGINLAHTVGDAQEFAGLRDYRAGDPRRHLHWPSVAKTARLIVKQYVDEYFDRHALIVDTFMAPGRAFETIIECAASFVTAPRARDAILDLMIAGHAVLRASSGRGLGGDLAALHHLASATPNAECEPHTLAALVQQHAAEFASVILVTAEDATAGAAALAELARRGLPTLVVRVVSAAQAGARLTGNTREFDVRVGAVGVDLARVRWTP